MLDVKNIDLPTYFEADPSEESQDSRFQKVKIYIAHTGENLNKSIFTHDVLESMIPSLAWIPILGYVKVDENSGDKDFGGHEKAIKLTKDGVNVFFRTNAYGFVPEDNDAHFEITGGKEWLVAEGYLWTRFKDVVNIFGESSGQKGQSMEVANADGYVNKDGKMVFTSADFTGLCILGDDVPPAMKGSTISTVFSMTDYKAVLKEMMAEFSAEKGEYAVPKKKSENGGGTGLVTNDEPKKDDVKPSASTSASSATSSADTKTSKPTESNSGALSQPATSDSKSGSGAPAATSTAGGHTADETHETGIEMQAEPASKEKDNEGEEPVVDDPKKKDSEEEACGTDKKKATMSEDDKDKDESDPEDLEDPEETSDDEKKKGNEFTLTLTDRQWAFISQVRNQFFPDTTFYVCPVSVFEDHGIVSISKWDDKNCKEQFFDIPYEVKEDDSVVLNGKTEVFPTYLTAQEVKKVEEDRKLISDLQSKIDELTAYKQGIEMSAKKQALEEARSSLTNDQAKAIEAKFSVMSPEEIEKEIAFELYKSDTTFQVRRGGIKATNFNSNEEDTYGSARYLFRK